MNNLYDYKRFAILYVDDEQLSLKYFRRAYDTKFRIYTAIDAKEGYNLFEQHKDEIAILITDQRMPGEKGVQLMERIRHLRPKTIRILTTAFSDIEAAVDAVNSGAVYKYITKPWDIPQLEMTLRRAIEFYIVQNERDQLLREKLSALHNLIIRDRVISLGIVAAGLGHYVRNALVAVRTFLDLAPSKLAEEVVDFDQLRNPNYWNDFYAHVRHQVARISEMLVELRAASQEHDHDEREGIQMSKLLDGVISKFKPELDRKKIKVANKLRRDLPVVSGDPSQFQRLFDLLFADEISNLPGGSRIQIEGDVKSASDDGDEGPENVVCISIEDNGPGLPEEDLRSVFDPFALRSDDHQDFGINLMACYFIVFHQGGRISASNVDEGGVRFELQFPIEAPFQGPVEDEQEFLAKVLMNDSLWERLLAGY